MSGGESGSTADTRRVACGFPEITSKYISRLATGKRRVMSTHRVSASAITIGVMFVLGALLTGIASAAPGNGNTTAPEQYAIVEFTDSPVAAYTGGIAGYPATEPLHGHKLDLASANVALYASYLHLRHASL